MKSFCSLKGVPVIVEALPTIRLGYAEWGRENKRALGGAVRPACVSCQGSMRAYTTGFSHTFSPVSLHAQ